MENDISLFPQPTCPDPIYAIIHSATVRHLLPLITLPRNMFPGEGVLDLTWLTICHFTSVSYHPFENWVYRPNPCYSVSCILGQFVYFIYFGGSFSKSSDHCLVLLNELRLDVSKMFGLAYAVSSIWHTFLRFICIPLTSKSLPSHLLFPSHPARSLLPSSSHPLAFVFHFGQLPFQNHGDFPPMSLGKSYFD